jgi:hypothetical protein
MSTFYLIRPYKDRYECEQDWDNWAKESKFMIAEDGGTFSSSVYLSEL